jgi:hypothetical protein
LYRFPGKNPLISLDFALNSLGFSFDFLFQNETFQGLIATPHAGKFMAVLSPHEERLNRVISAGAPNAPLSLAYAMLLESIIKRS